MDRALNPGRNDVTVAALKLCNVVVGFGSGRFARRLFGSMQWLPKVRLLFSRSWGSYAEANAKEWLR